MYKILPGQDSLCSPQCAHLRATTAASRTAGSSTRTTLLPQFERVVVRPGVPQIRIQGSRTVEPLPGFSVLTVSFEQSGDCYDDQRVVVAVL